MNSRLLAPGWRGVPHLCRHCRLPVVLQATFTELKEKACKAYNLEEVDVVMWDYWGDNYYGTDGPLDDYPDERLSKGKLMDKQPVMLLEKVMLAPCP